MTQTQTFLSCMTPSRSQDIGINLNIDRSPKDLQPRTPSTARSTARPPSPIRRLGLRTSSSTRFDTGNANTAPAQAHPSHTRGLRMAPRGRPRHAPVDGVVCQIGNWIVFVVLSFLDGDVLGGVMRKCSGSRRKRERTRRWYGFYFGSARSRLVRGGLAG
jgi:hypothetical protein